ncbi:MAG: hypothetical protein ACUVXI_01735 [bacterium]
MGDAIPDTPEETVPVEVEFYAGGRAEEEPRTITREGATYTVLEIVGSWYSEGKYSRRRMRGFTVRTADGRTRRIFRFEDEDRWFEEI